MLKIAVCDDDTKQVAFLEQTLAGILGSLGRPHTIASFVSSGDLCRALEGGERYHLIFLDVEFPEDDINGVQAARHIRQALRDNAASIVYISRVKSHDDFLFKTRPMDFLIKPLSHKDIEEAVLTYFDTSPAAEREFVYKKGRTAHMARIKDIAYLEARGRKIVIHQTDGAKDDFYGALKDLYEQQLKQHDFLFIHAAFAVNYDHVTAADYTSLQVSGSSQSLPVSQTRRNEVRGRYTAISKRRRRK